MKTLLVAAGGTGGHVFPALAVARDLKGRGVNVVWLGTRKGLEARVVPAAGFEVEWVRIGGLRGRGLGQWLMLPFNLALAAAQSLRILRKRRVDAVLAMGGFVAGPGGLAAWLARRPLVIHEQNAVAGFTNRWLARFADQVLCGFPDAFGTRHGTRHVGNPVRADIQGLPPTRTRASEGPLHLLVVGGSQGAQAFNRVVPETLKRLPSATRPQVWHQTGKSQHERTRKAYADAGLDARVDAFIEDMAAAYAWADLVLCRAGAMTIAELAAAGVASVLVPFPAATDDHQTANARFLATRDAAILLPQADLSPARLGEILAGFHAARAALVQMAANARAASMPDATEAVARACLEALHA